MKKRINIFIIMILLFTLTSCGMSISNDRYEEVSDYVNENKETISHTNENQFYDYEVTGLSIGGVYYGYY